MSPTLAERRRSWGDKEAKLAVGFWIGSALALLGFLLLEIGVHTAEAPVGRLGDALIRRAAGLAGWLMFGAFGAIVVGGFLMGTSRYLEAL
jgi:hypothetical protein